MVGVGRYIPAGLGCVTDIGGFDNDISSRLRARGADAVVVAIAADYPICATLGLAVGTTRVARAADGGLGALFC